MPRTRSRSSASASPAVPRASASSARARLRVAGQLLLGQRRGSCRARRAGPGRRRAGRARCGAARRPGCRRSRPATRSAARPAARAGSSPRPTAATGSSDACARIAIAGGSHQKIRSRMPSTMPTIAKNSPTVPLSSSHQVSRQRAGSRNSARNRTSRLPVGGAGRATRSAAGRRPGRSSGGAGRRSAGRSTCANSTIGTPTHTVDQRDAGDDEDEQHEAHGRQPGGGAGPQQQPQSRRESVGHASILTHRGAVDGGENPTIGRGPAPVFRRAGLGNVDERQNPDVPRKAPPCPNTPRNRARPVTVRVARWSATHPWRAIALWLVFVAACVAVGSALGLQQADRPRHRPSASPGRPRTGCTTPASSRPTPRTS